MIVGEHPRVLTVITDFLVLDCPFAYNMVIGQPTLKALNAITSINHITIKFPTAEGTRHVRGSQYDSRECYNQSIQMALDKRILPQTMMVEPRSLRKVLVAIDLHP